MIRLYDKNASREEVLTTNGLFNLSEIHLNSKITEEVNGIFDLELTLAVTDKIFNKEVYNFIVEEAIIKIDDEYGDEIFKIAKVRKDKATIYVYARQITIANQLALFLKDVRPENTNGQGALNHLLTNAIGRTKDTFLISDINATNTAYYMDMSLYDALFKVDNSFVKRWGGETLRRQYNCFINTKVGEDKGVVIKSKKNLVGFEINTNLDNLITRIIPKGYDTLEAEQVDSPLINNYSSIYTKVIKYDDIKVKNENNPDEGYDNVEDAKAELIRRANNEFSEFNVDKIQAEYTLNFIDLSKTEQYKDFQIAETVNIGDVVTVKEDTYNTEIKARVVKRVYSPKLKRRLETKISNIKTPYNIVSIESVIKELNKQIEGGKVPALSNYIDSMIKAGFKDSYVLLKPNEFLLLDNKDITKAKNVTRYNKNGFAFSTNGYYGDYTYGFTIDGKLNASIIATGILSTILIQNSDGSVQLDLGSKEGIVFKKNGQEAIKIANNDIIFFDWEEETKKPREIVGRVFSARKTTSGTRGVVIEHENNCYSAIGYKDSAGEHYSYIDFDKNHLLGKGDKADMYFWGIPSFRNGVLLGNKDETEIYQSSTNNLAVKSDGFAVVDKNTGNTLFVVNQKGFVLWDKNGQEIAWKNEGDNTFNFSGDVHIGGNLRVNGSYPRGLNNSSTYNNDYYLSEIQKKGEEIEQLKNRVKNLEDKINKLLK